MLALYILAASGAAIGALFGAMLGREGAYLGAAAGLIVSVLLWSTGFILVERAAPARLDDDRFMD